MLKRIVWIFAALLLAIQLVRPGMDNPPVDPAREFIAITQPPAEVASLLRAACYDCHSNETRRPWYAQVAPVSWWIANHVVEGREHLNFSEFGNLARADADEAMDECAETVREGEMPLPSYTWFGMHPAANLTDAQRRQLEQWFGGQGGGDAAGEPSDAERSAEGDDD